MLSSIPSWVEESRSEVSSFPFITYSRERQASSYVWDKKICITINHKYSRNGNNYCTHIVTMCHFVIVVAIDIVSGC